MASLAVTDDFLARRSGDAARMVQAMEQTHTALKRDVALASQVGRRVFPEREASLISSLVERDLPFYSTAISRPFVAGMNDFARKRGILSGNPAYADIVAFPD
jgi:hypothetical protein